MSQPPQRPLLIYDGECGFCRRWIDRWQAMTGTSVAYAPSQEVGAAYPEIDPATFRRTVVLVEPDGRISEGAEAVLRALATVPGRRWPLALYRRLPGFAPLAEAAYRQVASHRSLLSRASWLFWGQSVERPSWLVARFLFVRGLALVYLIAFVSLAAQVDGLLGPQGILPVDRFLTAARAQLGDAAMYELPSVSWLAPDLLTPGLLCRVGAGLALAALLGLAPLFILPLLWVLYLSLVSVGQEFLSYQWDVLLLEAGVLGVLVAPGGLRPGLARLDPPPRVGMWLVRWLLFRLMFMSGLAKLLSGDPVWHDLTALTWHYETQPLPTPLAWYAHALPRVVHQLSTFVMFAIELLVPFLIFLPRRPKALAASAITLLMVLIALTGNYTFFNLITIVLALALLDDITWRRLRPRGRRPAGEAPLGPVSLPAGRLRNATALAAFAVIALLSAAQLTAMIGGRTALPAAGRTLLSAAAPWHVVNRYGLFAIMTRTRGEISLEGTTDGVTWRTYEFRYKPGDPLRAPPWVAPHQPRLDWQMWFASLSNFRSEPWFANLMVRLIQNEPAVLALFASNPFPEGPPSAVRAVIQEYRFTHPGDADAAGTGAWWSVGPRQPWSPTLSPRVAPESVP